MRQSRSPKSLVKLIFYEEPEAHTKHYTIPPFAQPAARICDSNPAEPAQLNRGRGRPRNLESMHGSSRCCGAGRIFPLDGIYIFCCRACRDQTRTQSTDQCTLDSISRKETDFTHSDLVLILRATEPTVIAAPRRTKAEYPLNQVCQLKHQPNASIPGYINATINGLTLREMDLR